MLSDMASAQEGRLSREDFPGGCASDRGEEGGRPSKIFLPQVGKYRGLTLGREARIVRHVPIKGWT